MARPPVPARPTHSPHPGPKPASTERSGGGGNGVKKPPVTDE